MFNNNFLSFGCLGLAYYFVIYAFIGWLLETIYASLEEGRFINRGFLNGPFCPIYGFGAVLLIVALQPLLDNLFLLFIGATALTSALEYITGLVLEKVFKHKWWDYSLRRFNLQGRVCLQFSIYWGIISVLMLKWLQPEVIKAVAKIPYQYGVVVIYGLCLYFIADFAQTLWSTIELKSHLAQVRLLIDEGSRKIEQIKESSMESLEEAVEEFTAQYEMLFTKTIRYRRIFDAFPHLKTRLYDNISRDIKDKLGQISSKGVR